MKKINLIPYLFIPIVVLVCIAYCAVYHSRYKGAMTELDLCRHAPVRIDTITRIDTVRQTITVRPKPVVKFDTMWLSDLPCDSINRLFSEKKEYSDTLKNKDFSLQWSAGIQYNELARITFGDYTIKKEQIIKTITVDTCISKKPQYTPKNHFGLTAGVKMHDLQSAPVISAGIFVSWKDKWGLIPQVMWNPADGKLYFGISVPVYLR